MELINYLAEKLRSLCNRQLLDEAFKDTKYVFLGKPNHEKYPSTPFERQCLLKKDVCCQLMGRFDNWEADRWIVHVWGGISSFWIDLPKKKDGLDGHKRIQDFKNELKNKELTRNSYSVISSLSKIASFVNPEEYFVYDSRVAYTLNVLIMEYNEMNDRQELYYHVPSSRGGRTKEITEAIKNMGGKTSYDESKNYFDYIRLVKALYPKVFDNETSQPFKVEMLLFALGKNGGEMTRRLQRITNSFNSSNGKENVGGLDVKSPRSSKEALCSIESQYHPGLVLFIGEKGFKGSPKNALPYYCKLKFNNGNIFEVLGDVLKELSEVLDYVPNPKKTTKYIYSTKATTLDAARKDYHEALKILQKHGIF